MSALSPTVADIHFTVRKEGRGGFVIRDSRGIEVGRTCTHRALGADISTPIGSYRMQTTPRTQRREEVRGKVLGWQWDVLGVTGHVHYQILQQGFRAEIIQPGGQRLWMRYLNRRTTLVLGLFQDSDDRHNPLGKAGRQGVPVLRALHTASAVTIGSEVPPQPDPILFVALMFLLSCGPALGINVS